MINLIPKGLEYETIAFVNDKKIKYTTISDDGTQAGLKYQRFLYSSIWHISGTVYNIFVKSLPLMNFNLNDYEELKNDNSSG